MRESDKKREEEKLPRFQARTLGADELRRVTGGMAPETGSTHSTCHVDGVCDACPC